MKKVRNLLILTGLIIGQGAYGEDGEKPKYSPKTAYTQSLAEVLKSMKAKGIENNSKYYFDDGKIFLNGSTDDVDSSLNDTGSFLSFGNGDPINGPDGIEEGKTAEALPVISENEIDYYRVVNAEINCYKNEFQKIVDLISINGNKFQEEIGIAIFHPMKKGFPQYIKTDLLKDHPWLVMNHESNGYFDFHDEGKSSVFRLGVNANANVNLERLNADQYHYVSLNLGSRSANDESLILEMYKVGNISNPSGSTISSSAKLPRFEYDVEFIDLEYDELENFKNGRIVVRDLKINLGELKNEISLYNKASKREVKNFKMNFDEIRGCLLYELQKK